MTLSSLTFYFEDVFKDDTDFNQFLTDFNITLPTGITYTDLYNLFLDKYVNCSIAYDTKEVFKHRFKMILVDNLNEYVRRKAIIDKLYSLTDDELIVMNEYIRNYANNPNISVTDVFEELPYITQQENSQQRLSKLDAYASYLNFILPYGNKEFLNKFDKLFKQIFIREVEIYG